ncbi:unnamed protein product [Meloidogyne enterolobii]|uniref:Uncharacterized protein n=1 Tax=Meloidogyne enterolobii TaxID=390850 RepID=A0ACB1AY15_MELEN
MQTLFFYSNKYFLNSFLSIFFFTPLSANIVPVVPTVAIPTKYNRPPLFVYNPPSESPVVTPL